MRKIMLALDGSPLAEQALPYARTLVRGPGDELVLVRVTEPSAGLVVPELAGSNSLGSGVTPYLERLAAGLREQGLRVEVLTLMGLPREEILAAARSHHAELLVLASHGRSGWQRWLLGSVAENVARRAPCPTLIVRCDPTPAQAPALQRLLVPLDSTPYAERALEHVREHFPREEVQIILVGATSLASSNRYLSDRGDIRQGIVRTLELYLEEQARSLREDGWSVEQRVVDDVAAVAIVEVAAEVGAHLIVLASRGRHGLPRLVMGSVAEQVVRHAPCPTLLLPPVRSAQ